MGVVSAEILEEGRDHCEAVKMPDDRDFAAKGDLAKAVIQRLLASPLPITGETVDSVYGQEWRLRRMLEEAGVDYGLAVPKLQPVPALGRIGLFTGAEAEIRWGPFGILDSRVRARPRAGTLPPSDLVLHTGSAIPGVGH